jgi:hypothetical protein
MKAIALAILALSLAALAAILAHIALVEVDADNGMLNPTIRLTVNPGTRDVLFAGVLAAAFSAYGYAVIRWTDRRLQRILCLIDRDQPFEYAQPHAVQRLKDAIRAADPTAVERYARKSALSFRDERFFTPFELAELYGDQNVISALHKAARRSTNPAVPG